MMQLKVKEAASRLGLSQSLVYELYRLGQIRHTRHGRLGKRGTIRVPKEAIPEYLERCQQGGSGATPIAPRDPKDAPALKHIR
jgi:excisionase family DNA binding protein